MTIYKFRNCLLNTVERRVIRDGECLDLTPRMFDVLYMLVRRAGEIVTKDEMLGEIWNGSFVEEGNLTVQICKLRRLLGRSRREHYIETVYGTGYRFVCRTIEIDENEWSDNPFGKRGNTAESLTTEFSGPIVQRIKVANLYVVVKIEVEDVIGEMEDKRERERERELAANLYVKIEVCFAVFISTTARRRRSIRRWSQR